MTGRIRGKEDTGSHDDRIDASVSESRFVQHTLDTRPVCDVAGQTDGWTASGHSAPGHADAHPQFVRDLFHRRLRAVHGQIDTDDVRTFFCEAMRYFLADTRPGTDHHDDLARQLLFG